jgi:hypothetical protein
MKVVEAIEVIEAAEVLRSGKSLLRTELSRFLNSAFFFYVFKKYCFGRIMKYHIEIYHLFCRRLLRPTNVTFLKTGG